MLRDIARLESKLIDTVDAVIGYELLRSIWSLPRMFYNLKTVDMIHRQYIINYFNSIQIDYMYVINNA